MKQRTKKWITGSLIVLGILLAVPAWYSYRLGILPRIDRSQTFHAPVFGPDGRDVYYLTRNVWGVSWGLGIEFFTPPAAVIVLSDRFSLQRTDRQTGRTNTIHTFSADHPLKPRTQYRNYLFGIPDCELRWEGRALAYKIGIDFLPNNPPEFTVNEWSVGTWNADSGVLVERETWKSGYQSTDRWTEQLLSGNLEVVDYRGQALLLYDAATGTRSVLRVSSTAGRDLRDQLMTADLKDILQRPRLERSRTIRETYSAAVASFQAQGMNEGAAMLRANDEMEKKGYYPKSPKIVAQRIGSIPEGATVFAITEDEFRFGLFQDIEKAMASPGEEISFWGGYITHRDFDTSKRLNEYLDAGNRSFIVKSAKGLYLMKIEK